MVMDLGTSANDTLLLGGLTLTSSFFASIDAGRHLQIADAITGTSLVLLDWQAQNNQIESFVFRDGATLITLSYEEMVD